MNTSNIPPDRDRSLYQFWEGITNSLTGNSETVSESDWNTQVHYLSQSGIGTEEALHYMYAKQPSFEDFMGWLPFAASVQAPAEEYTGQVLTDADKDFWNTNGYLVIKNAVPAPPCEAARNAIWEFLEASPQDPESWYKMHEGKKGMMLNFFQHPALETNRNSARIKKVFHELYDSTNIYLLVDKVSFNPPETNRHKFTGSALHWDVSLHQPIPFVLQGLLYLTDAGAADGSFHCVPGFHHTIADWLASLPEGTNPRLAAVADLKPVAVPGNAGDLVIWHQALPHCATPNRGSLPRMVQYIAYKPVHVTAAGVWI